MLISKLKRFANRLRGHDRYSNSWITPTPACFEAEWYVKQYPDVALSGLPPWLHYITRGVELGYNPTELFWTTWYLEMNPDVAAAGVNPLIHYVMHGAREGRAPSPRFDSAWYAGNYGLRDSTNPLLHFIQQGRAKGYYTSEKLAVDGFLGGVGTFGANYDLLRTLENRLQHSGGSAFFEGRLIDGRAYMRQMGADVIQHPALAKVADAIRHEGACCLPPYLAHFEQVAVIPGSSSLLAGEWVINDEIVATRDMRHLPRQQKQWDRVWVNGPCIAIKCDVEITPRLKQGIHLFKEYEQNYFHFVCELLPKLYMIELMGVDHSIPLLTSDDLAPQFYEAIQLLKHPDRPLIKLKRNVPYAVERLTYLSDLSNVTDKYDAAPVRSDTFLHEELISAMAASIHKAVDVANGRARKLYMMRTGVRRKILNEGEIVEVAIRKDFDTPQVESLSFASQVHLFANSTVIVGGTGAAFTNLLWCKRGGRAIIMYPDHEYSNTTFWDRIAAARSVSVTYVYGRRARNVVGTYAMHDDFTVDIEQLEGVAWA